MSTLTDPNLWPDRYGDILYRHALFRLRDPMAAEEMVQETFLAALQARDRFAGNSSEKTWLVGILKHKIIDHLRKAIRERPHDEQQQPFDSLEEESFDGRGHWQINVKRWSNPDSSLENEQFWQTLNDCVSRLPPRLATLFIMREIDGLESETICQEMALSSTNNLWTMLSRMRMRLRQCLEQNWFGNRTR
ncbi:MAG: sigma-70 family RNA polymerase sigma factor [Pseudomonadota bacterium]|nr:sigma-70 family RNA polymerase sigma factor [Pseudomonadota bacterium]